MTNTESAAKLRTLCRSRFAVIVWSQEARFDSSHLRGRNANVKSESETFFDEKPLKLNYGLARKPPLRLFRYGVPREEEKG